MTDAARWRRTSGVDAWGNPTKAADLTSGMLRGGTEPLDIYRHIDAGINGTPMPSFHDTLRRSPSDLEPGRLCADVADTRRQGKIPESGCSQNGILKPLPGVSPDGRHQGRGRTAAAATRIRSSCDAGQSPKP